VDFVNRRSDKAGIAVACSLLWIGTGTSKWHPWKGRYGKANEHNARLPRDHWLEPQEKRALIDFHALYPPEGYRRLTFRMLDADVAACSPASVYRVLKGAGLLERHDTKPSSKGTGFVRPLKPHEHWHVDVSYLNIGGTFYYLCSAPDGCSRAVVHWEIREAMTEADVEQIIQRARERFPGVSPRIISDNGPQFLAKDFKEFIRSCGMTHVKTSPYYPRSDGKIERFHRTIKGDCIRPEAPLSLQDARRIAARYAEHYNTVRLHSAIGYVTPRPSSRAVTRTSWLSATASSKPPGKGGRRSATLPARPRWTADPQTLQRSQRLAPSFTYANAPKANFHFTLSQYSHRLPRAR
jgi:putative transposase